MSVGMVVSSWVSGAGSRTASAAWKRPGRMAEWVDRQGLTGARSAARRYAAAGIGSGASAASPSSASGTLSGD
ncbi:MAG: hypothetical protein M0Z28_29750, partial [Rhodospirillales bacterium]|nr:hypothetical protein [Rhodospirillales bacterium]